MSGRELAEWRIVFQHEDTISQLQHGEHQLSHESAYATAWRIRDE